MPAAPEPSLIAVSFVRSPIQAKEIFIKHSEKNYTILKAEKNREKGVPLTSDRSGSQKKLSKQSQKDNAVKAISNNSHPETFPGLVREYSEPQKKNLQPAQHGGELNISSPRYHAGSRENPLPDYPYVSRRRGEEGKVTCSVKVSPEGLPEQVEIRESSGHERLDQAAQNVLSSWVFEPAQKDFEKIYGFLEISITFRLTEGVKI
ncbi:Energy transducer TonB [Candidatus Bealeia paramacronuclearis]|uniref:Energy transducer TonB n=1 Tax=Candidatus Bealeia paramacronuclearis TaxID=1921001 RepID=A0ABZ2C0R5_9PROT|nr:Energy transducer TonB [Candidatus Bealeia paramacronuclearis]